MGEEGIVSCGRGYGTCKERKRTEFMVLSVPPCSVYSTYAQGHSLGMRKEKNSRSFFPSPPLVFTTFAFEGWRGEWGGWMILLGFWGEMRGRQTEGALNSQSSFWPFKLEAFQIRIFLQLTVYGRSTRNRLFGLQTKLGLVSPPSVVLRPLVVRHKKRQTERERPGFEWEGREAEKTQRAARRNARNSVIIACRSWKKEGGGRAKKPSFFTCRPFQRVQKSPYCLNFIIFGGLLSICICMRNCLQKGALFQMGNGGSFCTPVTASRLEYQKGGGGNKEPTSSLSCLWVLYCSIFLSPPPYLGQCMYREN